MNTFLPAGYDLLRRFEGLRLTAYKCPAGRWTVGYGHTLRAFSGLKVTPAEAEQLLVNDVARASTVLTNAVTVPLADGQFTALTCFIFNVGGEAFRRSTLLRLLNEGQAARVPDELRRWVHVGGVQLLGLVRRRAAEIALWEDC